MNRVAQNHAADAVCYANGVFTALCGKSWYSSLSLVAAVRSCVTQHTAENRSQLCDYCTQSACCIDSDSLLCKACRRFCAARMASDY